MSVGRSFDYWYLVIGCEHRWFMWNTDRSLIEDPVKGCDAQVRWGTVTEDIGLNDIESACKISKCQH